MFKEFCRLPEKRIPLTLRSRNRTIIMGYRIIKSNHRQNKKEKGQYDEVFLDNVWHFINGAQLQIQRVLFP